ncbi:MAG: aminopeptidase [Bdellovibrionales bacterium]|nr:aminopeptidase [Bdellovibrionales bacterium]
MDQPSWQKEPRWYRRESHHRLCGASRLFLVLLEFFALASISSLISGCQISYIVRSGYEQGKIIAHRRPLEKVLADPEVPQKVKDKIELAQKAKNYAVEILGLKATDNYDTYVDLERPYVSWIVQAAKTYKLEPYLWWFPIVGSVPYKGYFKEEAAKEEAAEFDSAKYDTYVRGVTAYSTLGWFRDPLLNTMMAYSDRDLVELIIHESVHATFYFKSAADFNERAATFLGQVGAEQYFQQLEGEDSEQARTIREERKDMATFSIFFSEELTKLKTWYEQNQSNMTKERKEERLRQLQSDYKSRVADQILTEGYKKILEGNLNNARLLAMKTYYSDMDVLEKLYKHLGFSFSKLLQECLKLKNSKNPEKDFKDLLATFESKSESIEPRPEEAHKTESH